MDNIYVVANTDNYYLPFIMYGGNKSIKIKMPFGFENLVVIKFNSNGKLLWYTPLNNSIPSTSYNSLMVTDDTLNLYIASWDKLYKLNQNGLIASKVSNGLNYPSKILFSNNKLWAIGTRYNNRILTILALNSELTSEIIRKDIANSTTPFDYNSDYEITDANFIFDNTNNLFGVCKIATTVAFNNFDTLSGTFDRVFFKVDTNLNYRWVKLIKSNNVNLYEDKINLQGMQLYKGDLYFMLCVIGGNSNTSLFYNKLYNKEQYASSLFVGNNTYNLLGRMDTSLYGNTEIINISKSKSYNFESNLFLIRNQQMFFGLNDIGDSILGYKMNPKYRFTYNNIATVASSPVYCVFSKKPKSNAYNFNNLCLSDSVFQLYDISTGSPTSWNWSIPGAIPSTSTLQNPIVRFNTSGPKPYTLIASNSNGAGTTFSGSLNINSNPSIIYSPSPAEVCYGGDIRLYASGANWYKWAFLSNYTSSNNYLFKTVISDTTLTVSGKNSFGCITTINIPVDTIYCNPTSVMALNESGFSFGPNPANGILQLFFNATDDLIKTEIYNSTGQIVFEMSYNNEQKPLIKLDKFSDGLYLLKVSINNKMYTRNFIIKH